MNKPQNTQTNVLDTLVGYANGTLPIPPVKWDEDTRDFAAMAEMRRDPDAEMDAREDRYENGLF